MPCGGSRRGADQRLNVATRLAAEVRKIRIPNEFVLGYGLDLDGLYRNLPFIGVVRD